MDDPYAEDVDFFDDKEKDLFDDFDRVIEEDLDVLFDEIVEDEDYEEQKMVPKLLKEEIEEPELSPLEEEGADETEVLQLDAE
jgi:hypothetical protein